MYLLAAFSRYPTTEENTSFVIFGFAFVLFVLITLAIITGAIGVLFKRADAKNKAKVPSTHSTTVPQSQEKEAVTSEENEHIPYLITAAVATIMEGQAHRIVSVNPNSEGQAQEGRR